MPEESTEIDRVCLCAPELRETLLKDFMVLTAHRDTCLSKDPAEFSFTKQIAPLGQLMNDGLQVGELDLYLLFKALGHHSWCFHNLVNVLLLWLSYG
jgi:hypothetical protein